MSRTVAEVAADLLDPPIDPYVNDPVAWVRERLGEHVWSKQVEILESVRDHPLTAVHSCHDAGKSFIAARTAAWWIDAHPPGEAFVVSTAPTEPQIKAILWQEINRAHEKGNLPGRVNLKEWWIGRELVGFGRKPADTNPAAFQGIHRRFVLVILDEACGIPKALWDAADALATNDGARILAIGNPDDPTSHFADVCKPGSGWHRIHIDGLETPNFTDEHVPDEVADVLLAPSWVKDKEHRWGVGTPLFESKVRGRFAADADDGVVRWSKASQCMAERERDPNEDLTPVELGVDVGAGGDFTSIRERRGRRAGRVWRDHSNDPEQVVGAVVAAIHESGATKVKIDSIGIGWGVAGWLRTKRNEGVHNAEIISVNVGAGSSDPKRFPKLRDQIWWEVGRELSEDGVWDLSTMDDKEDTVAQLIAPKYSLDASGRIKVEPKDETKKRIGRSPDDADGLLLAYFEGNGQGVAFMEAWQNITANDRRGPSDADSADANAAGITCAHQWGPAVGDTRLCMKCGSTYGGG